MTLKQQRTYFNIKQRIKRVEEEVEHSNPSHSDIIKIEPPNDPSLNKLLIFLESIDYKMDSVLELLTQLTVVVSNIPIIGPILSEKNEDKLKNTFNSSTFIPELDMNGMKLKTKDVKTKVVDDNNMSSALDALEKLNKD